MSDTDVFKQETKPEENQKHACNIPGKNDNIKCNVYSQVTSHSLYLKAFNTRCQSWDVAAGFAASGINVALDGILRLVAGLVERA